MKCFGDPPDRRKEYQDLYKTCDLMSIESEQKQSYNKMSMKPYGI